MPSSDWPKVPIGSVCLGIYDGPHATPPETDDGAVFLGIKNIAEDGHLNLSDVRHISESDFPRWTQRVLPGPGDIVFSYEATLNRYAMIPEGFRGCLGRRLALIRPDPAKIDGRFLFYYFFSDEWRNTIAANILSGSTVDRIPILRFPTFPVRLPPLPIQRNIASILGAYDDLIENNTRRIAIFEDMARSIYREWFEEFRFPGHEGVRMVPSVLGMIPEGWGIRSLRDITIVICRGISPQYSEDGNGMVINQRCIRDGRFNPFVMRRHSSTVQMDKLVQSGDVLINSTGIGTLGRVAQVLSPPRNCTVDSHVTIVRPVPEIDVDFLGAMLLAMEHHFASLGVGSTGQTELSRDRISDTLVLTASVDHQGAFGAVVHPLRERSGGVVEANQLLRDTRDLLLRHLMTGTQLT